MKCFDIWRKGIFSQSLLLLGMCGILFTTSYATIPNKDSVASDTALKVQKGPALCIEKGDQEFKNHNNEAALQHYAEALKIAPENYEALWKLSRAYVDIGDTYTDLKKRKDYFLKGNDLSRRAITINSDGSKGYLYQGIALGRIALDTSAKERIRLSKAIKVNFEKTVELDPEDDYAWHGLGRWHRKIATLSWIEKGFANMFLGGIPKEASVENAVTCFKKAAAINSGHINHHLELGISYEELKKKDLAIAAYKKVGALPKKDADDDRYKKRAEKRLEKLK